MFSREPSGKTETATFECEARPKGNPRQRSDIQSMSWSTAIQEAAIRLPLAGCDTVSQTWRMQWSIWAGVMHSLKQMLQKMQYRLQSVLARGIVYILDTWTCIA